MTAPRVLVFFADSTGAAEDLVDALDMARRNPWKPNPPGTPYGSPQEQFTDEETNEMIIQRLRRSAEALRYGANVIIP